MVFLDIEIYFAVNAQRIPDGLKHVYILYIILLNKERVLMITQLSHFSLVQSTMTNS